MATSIFPAAGADLPDGISGADMLRRIEGFDWALTPIGPPEGWSATVKATVRLMLASRVPMVMLVGPEGTMIYNDGYSKFAGGRHPRLLGSPVLEGWPEVAAFNAEVMRVVMAGGTLAYEDQELTLSRHGAPEKVWLDLDYSPVLDESAKPVAVLATVYETTAKVMTERALLRSEERLSFALGAAGAVGTWDWDLRTDLVTADERFAEMYGVDVVEAANGARIDKFLAGIHPDDRIRVGEEIQAAVKNAGPLRSEYRLQSREGAVRNVLALGKVIPDLFGNPSRLPGVVIDVSDQKAAEAALTASEAKFRAIADSMPQMVWSTLPDGFHDYYNKRWYEFTGVPEGSTDGEGWNGMFHPEDRERAWEAWHFSLVTGQPYQIEYRLRHNSGQYRWTLGRALPIRDDEGRITRWMGTCTDIHEAKLAAEEREVVAQELSHRIKNIFSVLTGIVALSARSHPEIKPLADALRQRIGALGQAHDFVRPHSKTSRPGGVPASLQGLIAKLLAPYEGVGDIKVHISGADRPIDDAAATPLALLFHELGTNSAKYGALSVADGSVAIDTRTEGERQIVVWKEQGGPSISAAPAPSGFGSRLIALSAEGQLGGKLERYWDSDGLRVVLDVPVGSLTRHKKAGA